MHDHDELCDQATTFLKKKKCIFCKAAALFNAFILYIIDSRADLLAL